MLILYSKGNSKGFFAYRWIWFLSHFFLFKILSSLPRGNIVFFNIRSFAYSLSLNLSEMVCNCSTQDKIFFFKINVEILRIWKSKQVIFPLVDVTYYKEVEFLKNDSKQHLGYIYYVHKWCHWRQYPSWYNIFWVKTVFDITHLKLVQKLEKRDVEDSLLSLINSFLQNHMLVIKISCS